MEAIITENKDGKFELIIDGHAYKKFDKKPSKKYLDGVNKMLENNYGKKSKKTEKG